MRRNFASALVTRFPARSAAACAVVLLIACNTGAASQVLDPGWQLVYAGQPGYGGDGLIESMFGDGTGQPVIARAYQPAPPDYQSAPVQQTPANQSAPAIYRQQASTPQPPAHRAPVYNQRAPVPQLPASQPAAAYYRQQASAPQPPAYQPAPVYYRQPPARLDPQYTGSVPTQRVRGLLTALSAPATDHSYQTALAQSHQMGTAPEQGAYQPANQYPQPAPRRRLAFGYETQQPPSGYQTLRPSYTYQPQQLPAGYQPQQPAPGYQQQQPYGYQPQQQPYGYQPGYAPSSSGDMAQPQPVDPRYERQLVEYHGSEQAGTIIIDTPHFFLYLVLNGGKALRYGIGVGRPGFTWAGVKSISAMREWPDWRPPTEMLARRPDLPRYMPGGPDNPLGARALYLGSTLYRIHGSNEPWSIGTQVSSGCIRLRNEDIIDLYERVKIGAKVVVI
jgi:lipoprotein-anchoring transpeptidase ErfK/SrfK